MERKQPLRGLLSAIVFNNNPTIVTLSRCGVEYSTGLTLALRVTGDQQTSPQHPFFHTILYKRLQSTPVNAGMEIHAAALA
jgi:hypothetical protein